MVVLPLSLNNPEPFDVMHKLFKVVADATYV